MKKIQVLGTGCPKCKLLMANAEEAVKTLGIEAGIEKVPAAAAALSTMSTTSCEITPLP